MNTIHEIEKLRLWVIKNPSGVVLRITKDQRRIHHATCIHLIRDYVKRYEELTQHSAVRPIFQCYKTYDKDLDLERWCLSCNTEKRRFSKKY